MIAVASVRVDIGFGQLLVAEANGSTTLGAIAESGALLALLLKVHGKHIRPLGVRFADTAFLLRAGNGIFHWLDLRLEQREIEFTQLVVPGMHIGRGTAEAFEVWAGPAGAHILRLMGSFLDT
ncbi:MAG TPA: hypothetical protein PK177_04835 [Burkholderiaceae bacterium]|nr:hypothetical protein [Burkholderiaceae bacterium]